MELTLKIGRSYAAEPKPKPPEMGEMGRSGTKTWAGRIFEDYKSDLSGRMAVDTYERMRRSDSQTAMTLRAIKLPILQATWSVVPSPEDEDLGEETAQLCDRMLFGGGAKTWRSTLRHALLMLDFGYHVDEIVWAIRDRPEQMKGTKAPEKIMWLEKLAPRLPQTIEQWMGLDKPPYELTGIKQRLPSGSPSTVDIPAEKLLIFTNEMEGDNYEGRSLLRSAYKDYYMAETLEKIDAIGLERCALGIPTVRVTDVSQISDMDAVREAYEDMLSNLQAMERSWMFLVPGTEFETNVPNYSNDAIRASIAAHKRGIAVNAIEQFLELGAVGGAGSRATADVQRGPFDLSLLAVAGDIGETISHDLLTKIVRYNYGERPGYPTLVANGVVDTDLSPLATIVKDLVDCGALVPDDVMEDWLRETLKLPAADRKPDTPRPAPKAPAEVSATGLTAHHAHRGYTPTPEPRPFWRDATEAERFVAFAQIKYDLAQAKDDFKTRVGEVAQEMGQGLAEQAAALVGSQDYNGLLRLQPPKISKLASKIKGELAPLVAYGRQTVRDEHTRARAGKAAAVTIEQRQAGIKGYADAIDLTTPAGVAAWQAIKAQRRAEAIATALEEGLIDEGLTLMRAGATEAVAATSLTETAVGVAERAVVNAAGLLISEGFNLGRGAEIQAEVDAGYVVKGIYSALLDDAVCDSCRALDGQEFLPSDPGFEEYQAGNPDCAGGDRCRCLEFLSYEGTEEPAVMDWLPGDNPATVMPQ